MMHGIKLPEGLVESQKFPEPLFTPSTKADQGNHDQNISPEEGTSFSLSLFDANSITTTIVAASNLIGPALYSQISTAALSLYKTASSYALSRGLILADTKFEFGLLPADPSSSNPSTLPTLILIDELLTPDSSRYWPLEGYEEGRGQSSFDKQFVRDWLKGAGFRTGLESGPEGREGEGWVIDDDIVKKTRVKYEDAVRMLMGDGV